MDAWRSNGVEPGVADQLDILRLYGLFNAGGLRQARFCGQPEVEEITSYRKAALMGRHSLCEPVIHGVFASSLLKYKDRFKISKRLWGTVMA